jgi:hypothetical protein
VNSGCPTLARLCALVLFLGALFGIQAEEHKIRLRNETITTPAKSQTDNFQLPDVAPVSGLFLIQFDGRVQAAWREQLKLFNVHLLRYVPDDTFIARFSGAQAGRIRSLPFVRWIGPYRPDHKLHPSLRSASNTENRIRVLIAPDVPVGAAVNLVGRAERTASTRFGTIVQTTVTASELRALSESPSILWIERAPRPKLMDEIASKIVGGDDGAVATPTVTQQLGYNGSGVAVAIADSGLHGGTFANMHPDLIGRVDAFFYYGNLVNAADEHSHGTHVTGIIAANAATGETDENGFLYGLGVASGAHVIAQRIFDGVGNYEAPPSYEVLTHDAVRAGAVIGSNSWGDDVQGEYDLSAAEFDGLVRDADAGQPGDQPYILEFSAGNAGPGEQTIDSPAVAKNVIATGASENDRPDFFIYADGIDAMADFSSRGPCADGRIKPDVVAPGTWIASTRSVYADDDNAWAPISANYMYQGGTSQAGPHVSGAAAVFVQYYRSLHGGVTPSPALVKAALINSAVDMDDASGTLPAPNNDEGWGRVDLTQIIGSDRGYDFLDQSVRLTNSQVYERRVVVASSDLPLKITLTYTDVPGFPGAIPALVNDLDLEVVGPDGSIYHGNQFDEFGDSIPGVVDYDRLNNVEAVHLFEPLPGEYTVRVRARNVVEDSLQITPSIVDQDFALVTSADLPFPGEGVLFFDRGAYRAPDQIKIKLIDFDLIGQPSVNIRLQSSTEPAGEIYLLTASGSAGVFTGTVATVTGAAANDGKLQVSHGDTITALYTDASPAGSRTATAVADLVPPVISAVISTNRFGKTVISWVTDEPATSIVRYGTNSTLNLSVTNLELVTDHEVPLDNLVVGRTYQFLVISADEAGNVTTNNNNFTFIPQSAPTVLLVDSYFYDPGYESLSPNPTSPISLSTYTGPLAQIGVSFAVWDVASRGLPHASDLVPFKVVIWRVNDSPLSPSTTNNLTTTSITALTNYLNSGGAFLMTSMEILSRLSDSSYGGGPSGAAFRTNYFKVPAFNEDSGVGGVDGVDNDPISSGLLLDLNFDAYPDLSSYGLANSADLSDTLTISTNAAAVFFDTTSNKIAGLRFPKVGQQSPYRVVFLPFPLDTVSDSASDPNNRATLLRNCLNFLIPGVNGFGTISFDNSAYTVPSVVTVEVADSDLAGQGQATVRFFSNTAPGGQDITLSESSRPGLFDGTIFLAAATNSFKPGYLRVANGDQIWATYFDGSAGANVQAFATVDLTPPGISNVVAEPEFGEATISWDTTEAADALVEFGESTFLGRTGYNGDFDFSHSVLLEGLQPDRLYYYRVISRDIAGNDAVDDNHGQLYTFRTLRPLSLPWSDNLESSGTSTNWTVITGEDSQVNWELGRPNNGRETSAYSPTNAYGCNLNGQNIDQAQTFLVSPALNLSGGNVATLKFWDSYDFPDLEGDIGETAQLYVSTNSGKAWILLADFLDSSAGWQEEEFDLTPYLGNTVRIGWYYEMLSFEPHPRPGWLVDDISVTVTNVIAGSIQITNNIAQAQWTLDGPISASGQGWNTLIPTAPAGTYVLSFVAVPYYQTPPPQTNVISTTNLLVLHGNYTFADANTNGISDAWEQFYFGNIASTRTRSTDSDGDGMTDYAEFIAGTNPTDAQSLLKFDTVRTNNTVRLTWPTTANHAYQLQGSANGVTWTPMMQWLRATGTNTSFTLPSPSAGAPYLFRVQVMP